MKLHLPLTLLLAMMSAFSTQAVEILDDYEHIDLWTPSDLDNYTSNTADDKYSFTLWTNINITPSSNPTWTSTTPLITGGNHIFSTAEGYAPVALSFRGGQTTVFEQPSNVTFDTLSKITISNQSGKNDGGAIDLGTSGKLCIHNVDDGIDNPSAADVIFSSNTLNKTSSIDVYGGAIYANGTATIIDISDNGDVSFLENSNFCTSYGNSSSYGGAIYATGSINIKNNADVIFSGNHTDVALGVSPSQGSSCYSYGGAIYSTKELNINNNADVSFNANSSTHTRATTCQSYGGAIYSTGAITINNNANVSFSGNYAAPISSYDYSYSRSSSYGGAIYSTRSIDINNNDDVSFNSNYVVSVFSSANGGAIYSLGTLNINNNADVTFNKNYAYYSKSGTSFNIANGGAIYSSGTININNNANVTFRGNYATSPSLSYSPYGGAIFSTREININNNADVIFSRNFVASESTSSSAASLGGAIYSTGSISIVGNSHVTFEKNYERSSSNRRLRSILMNPNSANDNLVLAAQTGGHITFNDSVYMSYYSGTTVTFNQDYQDEKGIIQKASGDIVFSGKYTEAHLKEVKGSTGTAAEITNSRTSELLNTVNLYGGTLSVEDKAVLNTHAINVVAEGNATMKVLDAAVNASSYDVTINSTGQLTLGGTDGSAKLTAKNININAGATLAVERTEPVDPSSVITLAASETVSIFNEKLGGVASGNLNLAAGSSYKADGAHLSVINGTLTFNGTDGEKINLILTLGAEYNKDSQVLLFTDVNTVKFVLDNITATKTGQAITLNAADYFTGDWISENTSLVYDRGTIYVTGVNRVIPEPTTTTLSLLALAALAARRRRNK